MGHLEGGRFVSSFNFCKMSHVPGATSSPPKPVAQTTTRPMQPSSRPWHPSLQVVPFLLSTFPPSCCSVIVALGTGLQQRIPLSSREYLTEFLFRDQPTPRRPMQQHPWDHDASSKANRKAFLNGPFKQWGTLFITEARFFNLFVKFQSSTRRNAPLRAAGRGN